MPSASNAAEFLLLDRLFPRSIIYSIVTAPRSACARSTRAPDRVGVTDQVLRAARPDPHRARVPADRRDPRRPAGAHGARAGGHARGERGDPAALLPDAASRRAGSGRSREPASASSTARASATSGDVTASYNEARMLPQLGRRAVRAAARRSTSGRSTSQHSYLDYWGTRVVDVRGAHAASRARRSRRRASSRCGRGPLRARELDWDELAPRSRWHRSRLVESCPDRPRPRRRPRSPRSPREIAARGRTGRRDRPRDLPRRRHAIEYMRGVTGVHSTAAEAWERAQGRLPGHRARRARRAALGRHPRALRLGLPAPRRGRGDRRRR